MANKRRFDAPGSSATPAASIGHHACDCNARYTGYNTYNIAAKITLIVHHSLPAHDSLDANHQP